jgi:four helix bundle protein
MFGLETLDVWTKALEWADHLYTITDRFPKEEMFGLKSQIRHAATSLSANMAASSGRRSNKDIVRFLHIAFGSLGETVSHMCLARRRNLIPADHFESVYAEAEELARMRSGLRASLERREDF